MNLDLDSWGERWEDIGQPLRLAQLGANDNELAESVIVAGILHLVLSWRCSPHYGPLVVTGASSSHRDALLLLSIGDNKRRLRALMAPEKLSASTRSASIQISKEHSAIFLIGLRRSYSGPRSEKEVIDESAASSGNTTSFCGRLVPYSIKGQGRTTTSALLPLDLA